MTVSSAYSPDIDDGDGVSVIFPVTFRFDNLADVRCTIYAVDGTARTPAFTVTGSPLAGGGYSGGSLEITDGAPLVGETVLRSRETTLLQQTNYQAGNFPSAAHERSADRLVMAAQERAAIAGRTLRFDELTDPIEAIPPVALDHTLIRTPEGFGEGPAVTDIAAAQANAAAALASQVAAAASQAAAAASQAAAAASEAAAAASALAADGSADAAALSAAAALASQTAAAASEAAADADAASAAASALAADGSADAAALSAAAALASETAAAASAAAAAASEAGAAASAAAAAASAATIDTTRVVPVGAVGHFAMNSAPSGWLKANGAAVSRATYAALFAAIGTTFGVGDGATTFNLPDLRGEFLRGWDDGRGVDSGRAFGSAQGDDNKAHTHGGASGSSGDHAHGLEQYRYSSGNSGSGGGGGWTSPGGQLSGGLGWFAVPTINAVHAARMTTTGAHTHTIASDGTEARPRNVAVLACIKF
jgi:hypothetical protein